MARKPSRAVDHQWTEDLAAGQARSGVPAHVKLDEIKVAARIPTSTTPNQSLEEGVTHTEPLRVPTMKERLRIAFLRTALGRLWSDLDDKRRRTRSIVLIGWGLMSVIAVCVVIIRHRLYVEPSILDLPLAGLAAAQSVSWGVLMSSLLMVVALSGATYWILYHGVIQPLEEYRERINSRIAAAGQEKKAEVALLNFSQQKRTEQLEAAMTDNEILREEKAAVEQSLAAMERLLKSTYETITDRIIVVDREGRVIEVSPLTIDLIGIHRTRIIGERFDGAVNLYDPFRENPLEYPIRDSAKQVLETAAVIPKMSHVLVVAPHGQQERVLMTSSAVLDQAGQVVGASFRFESDTSINDSRPGSPGVRAVKTDRVTGLPGREMFNSRLRELIELARVRQTHHVLMLVGIDNMHAISDTFGQRASEELLWNVTQIVQAEAGASNQCYRITADFIGVVFALSDSAAVQSIAGRICSAVAARIFAWREARYECTVSCGVVDVDGECEDIEPVLELANNALLSARTAGGNRVQVIDAEHPEVVRRRSDKQWVDWLLPRLENGQTHLVSQSIVPLQVIGARLPMFEVFLRVEDDDGVWITPGAFLQAVERFGYSARLDLWVLQAVMDEFGKNPDLLEKNAAATINLSGASLEHPEFAEDVVKLITLSGISGKRICFEIDEPYAVSRLSVVTRFINAVKSTGAMFALDRYKAAGGLDALRDLPIHFLKVHESLVRRLNADQQNPVDLRFIGFLHEACEARGIKTVAAGIENASALETLKAAGIDYGQGVLINKFGPVMT